MYPMCYSCVEGRNMSSNYFNYKNIIYIIPLLSLSCQEADQPPPPALTGTGPTCDTYLGCHDSWIPGGDTTSAVDSTADGGVDNTGGGPVCEFTEEFEGVLYDCIGFAIGVYEYEDGTLTILDQNTNYPGHPMEICIHPEAEAMEAAYADTYCESYTWNPDCESGMESDQFAPWEPLGVCAPWHEIDDIDYDLQPGSQGESELMVINELQEQCKSLCEQNPDFEAMFPATVNLLGNVVTFHHHECEFRYRAGTNSPLYASYGKNEPGPCMSSGDVHGVEHATENGELVPAWCEICTDEPQMMSFYDCGSYTPSEWVTSSTYKTTTTANMTIANKDELLNEMDLLWACDSARYLQSSTSSTTWTMTNLTTTSFLYKMGFRNGDKNLRVARYNLSTKQTYGTLHTLNSVNAMMNAAEDLLPAQGSGGVFRFTVTRGFSTHYIVVIIQNSPA